MRFSLYHEIYCVYLEIYCVYLEIYDYGVLVQGVRFPDEHVFRYARNRDLKLSKSEPVYPSGRLRYMISYMISCNYDIAYDIICLELSMIS